MKEHTQTTGIRKWAGDDLVELQKEPLDALQALVEPYAPCIIQGCVPTPNKEGMKYTVSPGFVALKGKWLTEEKEEQTGVKIVRFAGKTDATLPLYLGLACKTENRAYADGGNKPIKYQYEAAELNEDPGNDFCLTITATDADNPHLVDKMGISEKLKQDGGDASKTTVSFTEGTSEDYTEELKSGNSLSKLFGAIKGWLSSVKKKLDGIDEGANKYIHPKSVVGIKGSGLYKIATDANGHVTAATAVTKADITNLDIPGQDTVYKHPTSVVGVKGSGLYKIATDANGHVIGATAVTKKDITDLGVPAQDTTYGTATQSTNGLMSSTDKTKLDGIAPGANKYSHPTSEGNKHIPTGGSSGQYLKYSAVGTAAWASPGDNSNLASSSTAGFMAAADKSKLDKIDKVSIRIVNGNTIRLSWDRPQSGSIFVAGYYYVDLEGKSSNPSIQI
ncbi:MAG: hypothetical protein NC396_09210 [Bacteroides sp.]|nr:hypothetical protein [Bacteroides sp.]MCM1086507.1 hypothetical protein [Bacteroides sp.]